MNDFNDPEFVSFLEQLSSFSQEKKREFNLISKDLVSDFIQKTNEFEQRHHQEGEMQNLISDFKKDQLQVRILVGLNSNFALAFSKEHPNSHPFFSQIDALFQRYFQLVFSNNNLRFRKYRKEETEFSYFVLNVTMTQLYGIQKMLPNFYWIKMLFKDFKKEDLLFDEEKRHILQYVLKWESHLKGRVDNFFNLFSCGSVRDFRAGIEKVVDWENKVFELNKTKLKHPPVFRKSQETIPPHKNEFWKTNDQKDQEALDRWKKNQRVAAKEVDTPEKKRERDFREYRRTSRNWPGKENWQKASNMDDLLVGPFLLNWDEKLKKSLKGKI